MPLESGVKFRSPQNISGGSQQNSDAAFCQTTEVDGDLFYHKMAPYSNPSPQKPRNNVCELKTCYLHIFLRPKSSL